MGSYQNPELNPPAPAPYVRHSRMVGETFQKHINSVQCSLTLAVEGEGVSAGSSRIPWSKTSGDDCSIQPRRCQHGRTSSSVEEEYLLLLSARRLRHVDHCIWALAVRPLPISRCAQ
jgi:hypothetical protein